MIGSPTALIVAHPGHELRLLRWVELLRPIVFVITDGSGRSGRSRIECSRDILRATGSSAGSIFGRLTDREVYQVFLNGDVDAIAALTVELAEELKARGVRSVIADAFEFYNPTHDLCAIVAGLVVARVRSATGRMIDRYDFAVTEAVGEGVMVDLDQAALDRKLTTARSYEDLAVDVDELVGRFGVEALRTEVLRPVLHDRLPVPEGKPYYELRGEQQVAAGRYGMVVRYGQHFLPLVEKLIDQIQDSGTGRTRAAQA